MTDKKNPRVLLVDDEPVSLKILENTLIKEGCRIIKANNGPKARAIASTNQPDIILLDIVMPGEDGFRVLKLLKKDPRTAYIPVIFLSGMDDLENKIKGFKLGAVDFITKPFYSEEVLARVRLHLKLSLATNSLIENQAEKLKQVKDAQESMLITPDELPEGKFGVYYMTLLEAGGDFYDVLKISDGIFGYFVADVSGHDIATSYIISALKALLKQNCISIYEPVESMRMINNVLEEILPDGKYLTACYIRLNRNKKRISIVDCGHPPVIYLPKTKEAKLIVLRGDVLGIFKDVYFEIRNIDVNYGDRFLLYSDGLVERPENKKMWTEGVNDLLKACGQLRNGPIEETVNELKYIMCNRLDDCEDDIVLMGIEV